MSARQVDELSLWEAAVMAEAIQRFHGGADDTLRPFTPEQHDALMEKWA